MNKKAILETLFIRPPSGPRIRPEEDFIEVRITNLDFLSKDIEANETIVLEKDSHPIDWDRLYYFFKTVRFSHCIRVI